MPTVTVYAHAGAFGLKNGAPILNASFKWVEHPGNFFNKKPDVYHPLEATGSFNGVYTVTLPFDADVNVSAPGHGDSTERMASFGSYTVRL